MSDRTILHVDCNAFFASVECLLNPQLNETPTAVCGDPASRHGIILAKNEKAKKFGITTAETVWQAKRKCPGLVLVPPHPEEYTKYSRLCNEIYLRFTDLVEPFGIDESFLDVTGSMHLFGDGKTIADTIRSIVREETGLTVSVGVSFNKIFAKLGSDYKKPDATTVITREAGKKIVWPLPVTDMLFVGKKTAEVLSKLQIKTIGDLAKFDRDFLTKRLGQLGGQIHDYANGKDNSPVASFYAEEEVKSVGNGTTFEYDVTDWEDLKTRVLALCDSVGWRLRHKNLKCRCLQISIKDPNFKTINRQKILERPTNLTRDLYHYALDLIRINWQSGKPIRLVTVTASKLEDADKLTPQLSLFEYDADIAKQEVLQTAMDGIRDKFGRKSISFGSAVEHKDMKIHLKKATINDCEKIHQMQTVGFKALLDKYQDFETNPGAETIACIKKRFEYLQMDHYFIELNDKSIGYIRIDKLNGDTCKLSQMFILPEYQGKGYAQQAIKLVESLNPQAKHWILDAIKQEPKLCCLYEKMGYKQTGIQTNIKVGMDLVDYAK